MMAFLLATLLHDAAGQSALSLPGTEEYTVMTGEYTVRRFIKPTVLRVTSTGSFEVRIYPDHYWVRALNPNEIAENGVIAMSDYRHVYQSERILKIAPSNGPANPSRHAYGRFDIGVLPNGFDSWGAIQALSLANIMTKRPQRAFNAERTSLVDDCIPGLMRRRARELNLPSVKGEVEWADGGRPIVRFWVTDEGKAPPYAQGSDCFLVGELHIKEIRDGMPTSAFFCVNDSKGFAIADATFMATAVRTDSAGSRSIASYDADAATVVSDTRYGSVTGLNYLLQPSETPPFEHEGNPSYQKLVRLKQGSMAKVEEKQGRRKIVVFFLASTAFLGIGAIYALIRRGKKKQA